MTVYNITCTFFFLIFWLFFYSIFQHISPSFLSESLYFKDPASESRLYYRWLVNDWRVKASIFSDVNRCRPLPDISCTSEIGFHMRRWCSCEITTPQRHTKATLRSHFNPDLTIFRRLLYNKKVPFLPCAQDFSFELDCTCSCSITSCVNLRYVTALSPPRIIRCVGVGIPDFQ